MLVLFPYFLSIIMHIYLKKRDLANTFKKKNKKAIDRNRRLQPAKTGGYRQRKQKVIDKENRRL